MVVKITFLPLNTFQRYRISAKTRLKKQKFSAFPNKLKNLIYEISIEEQNSEPFVFSFIKFELMKQGFTDDGCMKENSFKDD